MSNKDRTKQSRKRTDQQDEDTHRAYKVSKQREHSKNMKALERALRTKDYDMLTKLDYIYG